MKKWASIGLAGALAAAGLAGAVAADEAVVARLVIQSVLEEAAYATSAARGIELYELARAPAAIPVRGGDATETVPAPKPGSEIAGRVPAGPAAGAAVASAATAVVPAARPEFSSSRNVTAPPRRRMVRTNGEAGKRRFRHPVPVAIGVFR